MQKLTLLLCYFLILISFAYGQNTIELAYDDGEPNLNLTFINNAGLNFITRFTPTYIPVKLVAAKYYLADTTGGTSFDFSIMEDSNNEPAIEVYGPVAISGGKLGWNEIDLTEHNLQVDRDFYLILKYDYKSRITIGAENREPLSGRTYDADCCSWWIWEEVDLLLRAVIQENQTDIAAAEPEIPVQHRLVGNYPNPFNNETIITFQLVQSGKSVLTIFDLQGCQIRHWENFELPAGSHAIKWDGSDQFGLPVPSGIYYCRFDSENDRSEIHKLLLVR